MRTETTTQASSAEIFQAKYAANYADAKNWAYSNTGWTGDKARDFAQYVAMYGYTANHVVASAFNTNL